MSASAHQIEINTLQRRVRWIVAFTISYNILEAILSIGAGSHAESSALIAFGLDSVVEVLSAAVIAWQYTRKNPERWEDPALKGVGLAFFALALYVSIESISTLIRGQAAEHSTLGIAIAIASIIIMPTLAWYEYRTGKELGSASVMADAKQLLLCSYLSLVLLVGLLLNSLLGWWWADPIAALIIAFLALREGKEAWEGDACCATPAHIAAQKDAETQECCHDC